MTTDTLTRPETAPTDSDVPDVAHWVCPRCHPWVFRLPPAAPEHARAICGVDLTGRAPNLRDDPDCPLCRLQRVCPECGSGV